MLEELCRELKNWFEVFKYFSSFTIENGEIVPKNGGIPLKDGQYFRIIGSVFNDGIYQYPASGLTDESFDGAIWALAIPKEFLALAAEIEAWQAKYGDIGSEAMSPYSSESFGGYSYSKSGGGASDGKSAMGTWKGAFASRLSRWRKI